MLTFGAGSSCDVCFERFGQDSKAPCSIPCGHVFCVSCVSQLALSCPLCRKPFVVGSCIKLHVDLDAIPPEQTSGCQPDEIKEAQRLHSAIARIADVGIEEQGLRQLIQETRNFLHGKPRHLFHDLRVAHRMIAYMCELKSDLRNQRSSNDTINEQIKTLTAEKEDLLNKLERSEQERTFERDTALAVEKSLRDHNALAVRNYHILIEVYNKLAKSTAGLLQNVPLALVADKGAGSSGSVTRSTVATLPPLDMSALEGVAVRDTESSFLISPLPQFTNVLPAVLGGMTPLPELTEDVDGEKEEEEEEEEEISTPDSAHHDRGEIPPSQSDHYKPVQVSRVTHTAPYHRARSHSIPSHSTSPGSPSSGRSDSASPPKLVLQDLTPARPSSYSRHTRDTYTSSLRNSNPDGDALRNRLHDLLRDSPTSSSLPNMPSIYLSSSLNKADREPAAPNTISSPPPSHVGGTTSTKPSLPTHHSSDSFSHLLASGSQLSNKHAPVPSPIPFVGQRYSSASTEAKKLEEERRRKHLEEKQQKREERYKAERQRDEKQRDDRHRESQERQKGEKRGDERLHPADREYTLKVPPSTPATSRWDQSLPSNQNYIYANPNSVSPVKRGPSNGNGHNQPSGVPSIPVPEHVSGQHARYAPGSSGGHKSRPVPIPSTNSAHTYS